MSETSESQFYMVDVDGNRRVPFKQRNRADGRFGFSILPPGKGNDPSAAEYTEDVTTLIRRVVLDRQLVRARIVGGEHHGQINSVGLGRREVHDYWIAPQLRHLVAGEAGAIPVAVPDFDAEARVFLEGFLAADNPQFVYWLPRYRETLRAVDQALQRGMPEAVFDLIWKSVDNAVSNAGQGVLGFDAADRARDALVEVIREIGADGSPSQFDRLMAGMEQLKQAGDLPKVPRLLLARAFAAIHPDRYHTTVDAAKQEHILPWFEAHTGFVAPPGNWAVRAEALTRHLDRCGVFEGDRERRNMFPWYVFDQLRDASGELPFRHGHTSRPPTGEAQGTSGARSIEYRHNVIQDALVGLLRKRHGVTAVASEHPTGTGGRADALVRREDGRYELYEIKPAATAADAVRQAMGQLLEYAYRRGGLEPAALHVVSDAALDERAATYLSRLQSEFGLPIGYLQVSCDMERA